MHLPCRIADYVDFYASEHHASNLGRLFRPDVADPLLPNWKHLPVGYHGRSSTIVVSGVDIVRPCGQRKGPADAAPVFGPSTRLDIEAELGFLVGVGNATVSYTHLEVYKRQRSDREPPAGPRRSGGPPAQGPAARTTYRTRHPPPPPAPRR